jgi:hypothetical protein
MLEKEQRKFRSEYEARFRELERERVAIQDDKAKVWHYCKSQRSSPAACIAFCILMLPSSKLTESRHLKFCLYWVIEWYALEWAIWECDLAAGQVSSGPPLSPGAVLQMQEQRELLLKQRDIMLALTKRLSDRDEQILMLQEELDAYDAAQRQLEDALDQRVAEIFALRKAALQQVRISSPGHKDRWAPSMSMLYLTCNADVWLLLMDCPHLFVDRCIPILICSRQHRG